MIVLAGPSHPGRVLKDHYLDPLNMSAGALAGRIEASSALLVHLVKGEVAMTADTAVRLARFFGNTAEYWEYRTIMCCDEYGTARCGGDGVPDGRPDPEACGAGLLG